MLVLFPAIQKIDDLNIDCFLIFLTVHKVEIFGGLAVIGQELSLRIQEESVEQGSCFFYFCQSGRGADWPLDWTVCKSRVPPTTA